MNNFDIKNCNNFVNIDVLNINEIEQLKRYLSTTNMKHSFVDYLAFEEGEYTASKKERNYKPDTKTDREALLRRGIIVTFGAGECLDILNNAENISFNGMHLYSILELLAYTSASLTKELVKIAEKDSVSKARCEYRSSSDINNKVNKLTVELEIIRVLDSKIRSLVGPGELKIIEELFNQNQLFKILSMLKKREGSEE